MNYLNNTSFIGFTLFSTLCFFTWLGFGVDSYQIDICKSTVTKYVTAEFSELETGIDFEGNFYSEINNWSERTSDVYTETVINETPIWPLMPEHDKSFSYESNFDNFRFHTYTKLTIEAFNNIERTVFSDDITKVEGCLNKLDQYVEVKTWWSITYGSDFNS